mmetsp:Transcript_57345/g.132118  ORF Transcript_57345/g.132118 Transcript_57345/m.132118 type:complete len:212 (-) Transcript_57345:513-1148(-)
MAGVPASNRAGGGANVERSKKTSSIISPPPCQGGIAASTSWRPHRKPTPVGPHILCPEATSQSTPRARTSTGWVGTLWQASSSTRAPRARAAAATSATGFTQPSALEAWTRATSFVRSESSERKWSRFSRSSGVRSMNFSTARLRWASSCQGTRLLWCSILDRMISSPSPMFCSPQVLATRLMASVAPRVHTISSRRSALMKCWTLSRAAS